MKLRNVFLFTLTGLLIAPLLFSGCKIWHDTNARYNSYFLAKERMKKVDQFVWDQHTDDYNKVLVIYPDLDSNKMKPSYGDTDYIIEKASWGIHWHEISKWTDDGYVVLGKARYYQYDLEEAKKAFNYVKSKGKDDDAINNALAMLLRVRITEEDYGNATILADQVLKRASTFTDENAANFYLARAWLYQKLDNIDIVEESVEEALKHIKRKKDRARYYFILGQIKKQKDDKEGARKNFKGVLKSYPTYEQEFFAKLYMSQVVELTDENAVKKNRKYFKKLLEDDKNKEYRDKIFYEMALFELSLENKQQAIDYLKQSVKASSGNSLQKGYTYLKLGEILYDIRDYETSKLYYDSTVSTYNKEFEEFEAIAKRQKILEEFVEQLTIVRTEDSLQTLYNMSDAELNALVDKVIAKKEAEEEARRKREEEQRKAELEKKFETVDTKAKPGNWYFYNPKTLEKGKEDFVKKWGDRRLEDNWRRSNKQPTQFTPDKQNEATASNEKPLSAEEIAAKKEKERKLIKQEMLAQVPKNEEAYKASEKKLMDALFELGKIYNLKLNEPDYAIETFESLLTKFPKSTYRPEILYMLYLITTEKGDKKAAEAYKQTVLSEYPNSLYAKIIKNPSYEQESKVLNKKAREAYKKAYFYYSEGLYRDGAREATEIMNTYPHTDIMDRLVYLKILCEGREMPLSQFRSTVESFINAYKTSELIPDAKELLVIIDQKIASGGIEEPSEATAEGEVVYDDNLNKVHYVCVVFNRKDLPVAGVMADFKAFNNGKYEDYRLNTSSFYLNDSTLTLLIKEFKNKYDALNYDRDLNRKTAFTQKYNTLMQRTFVITFDNFKTLYNSRKLDKYMQFYRENY